MGIGRSGSGLSIQSHLGILVAALLFPVLIFEGLILVQFADTQRDRYQSNALDVARRITVAVDREISAVDTALQVLAGSRRIEFGDIEGFRRQAEQVKANLGTEVVLRGLDGGEVMNTDRTPAGATARTVLDSDDLRAVETRATVVSPLTTMDGGPAVTVTVPVLLDGVAVQLLEATVRPERLATMLALQQLPEDWTAALVDQEGRILARSRHHDRFVGSTATEDLRRIAVDAEGTWTGTTAEGTPVLSAYVRSSVTGWRAAVGVPLAAVERPLRTSMERLLLLGLVSLVASGLLAYNLGRRIARPIDRLNEDALALGAEPLQERPPSGVREVDGVRDALVRVAADLARRTEERDAAQVALRASRDRLERVLDITPVAIIETDGKGEINYANAAAAKILGLIMSPVGRHFADPAWGVRDLQGRPVPPDDLPVARALRGEAVSGYQHAFEHETTGESRILLINAVPVRDDGVVTSALVAFADITARHEADLRRMLLVSLGDQIGELCSMEAIVAAAAPAIGRVMRIAAIGVTEVGDTADGMAILARVGPDRDGAGDTAADRVTTLPASECPMSSVTRVFAGTLRTGATLVVGDVAGDPRIPPELAAHLARFGVAALVTVPCLRQGDLVAVFSIYGSTPLRWRESEAALARDAAERIWAAVERARAQADLRAFADRLEGLVEERTRDLVESNAKLLEEVEQRERVEDQLRHSLKMEAVGQLTGGIAHDFNNLLAVILGSLQMLKRRMARGETGDMDRYIDGAVEGANRAANLTRRLLAFARRQPLSPEPIDVNRLVGGMSDLLGRTLGEAIRIETVLAGGLWTVHSDPNQLENAIVNLAVNARDAMREGGNLTIETANTDLDRRYAHENPGVAPGQYVMIALTDTGVGMAPDVAARAFDPFFTTKPTGQGTGLGLSQVYGFLRQTGGHVKIYSEPGHGTTVKLYLPRWFGRTEATPPVAAPTAAERPSEDRSRGSEAVLVVEDEPQVRRLSAEALAELGYRVFEADGAQAALAVLDAHPEIRLLFTDVVMPEVNGRRLADEALKRRPGLRVLFTTGYTRNAVIHNGVLDPGVHLVVKPFTLDQLAAKVREALDG